MRRQKMLEFVEWSKIAQLAQMVAEGTMERADMSVAGTTIKIYAVGTVLRIDFN